MGSKRISLTPAQRELMALFYGKPFAHVIYTKKERTKIWNSFKKSREIPTLEFQKEFPSIVPELQKNINEETLNQSGILSECVYAQTLANILDLKKFYDFAKTPEIITHDISKILETHKINPRYVFTSTDQKRLLVQAGGNVGVDASYIDLIRKKVYGIEFKEPAAKISEHDLPLYGEDGYLVVPEDFISIHSHYEMMLKKQLELKLNFWEAMGTNINNFDNESVEFVISQNYSTIKFADVICVEDKKGYLTMIPANQATIWTSRIKGEIRPAGRNSKQAWTPKALRKLIESKNGKISENVVSIPLASFRTAKGRGSSEKISRYKLSPIFYLKAKDIKRSGDEVVFNIEKVHQLKPTISAHLFFNKLDINEVHSHYGQEI